MPGQGAVPPLPLPPARPAAAGAGQPASAAGALLRARGGCGGLVQYGNAGWKAGPRPARPKSRPHRLPARCSAHTPLGKLKSNDIAGAVSRSARRWCRWAPVHLNPCARARRRCTAPEKWFGSYRCILPTPTPSSERPISSSCSSPGPARSRLPHCGVARGRGGPGPAAAAGSTTKRAALPRSFGNHLASAKRAVTLIMQLRVAVMKKT